MSAPRMAGPHGRDFGCGKVGDPRFCSPGTPFPSKTRAEPFLGKHPSTAPASSDVCAFRAQFLAARTLYTLNVSAEE